jgi:hypothetical protein
MPPVHNVTIDIMHPDIKYIPALDFHPDTSSLPVTGDTTMVDDNSTCSCPSLVNSSTDESSIDNDDNLVTNDMHAIVDPFPPDSSGKFMILGAQGKMEQRIRHDNADYNHITIGNLESIKDHVFSQGGFLRFHTATPSFASRAESFDGTYRTIFVNLSQDLTPVSGDNNGIVTISLDDPNRLADPANLNAAEIYLYGACAQHYLIDQFQNDKIAKHITATRLLYKGYGDQFHYEPTTMTPLPTEVDSDRFGYGYFPFQFSFCDGESGIPFTPQDAFDFWERREEVTMDFHLYSEGSLTIDDSKFLQAELDNMDDLPSLFSQRYANKTHYLEPISFSELILIRQMEYFLNSVLRDDCSMIEFVPRQSIRDDPPAFFKAELAKFKLQVASE